MHTSYKKGITDDDYTSERELTRLSSHCYHVRKVKETSLS